MFSFHCKSCVIFCEGIILAIALFAVVNNTLGIFVIVHYIEFVFCKCNLYYSTKGLFVFYFKSQKFKTRKWPFHQPRLRRYPRSEAKRLSRKRELQLQIVKGNSLQKKQKLYLKIDTISEFWITILINIIIFLPMNLCAFKPLLLCLFFPIFAQLFSQLKLFIACNCTTH